MIGDCDGEVCAVSDRESCGCDVGDCTGCSKAKCGAAVLEPARLSVAPETGPLVVCRGCLLGRVGCCKGIVQTVADCSGAESDEEHD